MEQWNEFLNASDSKLKEFVEIGSMTHSWTAVTQLLEDTARFPDNTDSYHSPDTKWLCMPPERRKCLGDHEKKRSV